MSVLRSSARGLIASALLVGSLAAPSLIHLSSANAAPTAVTTSAKATAALVWLADELDHGDPAHPHVLGQTLDIGGGPTFFPDYGLTADAVMALTLGGVRPAEAAASLATVEDNLGDYVTSGAFGPDDRYAGALGKSLLLAEITDEDPTTFGGFDLETELRARLQTTGDQTGRFSDLTGFGDFSNGFGQAIDMIALSRTDDGVPAPAIAFLLAQQCPNGGFRGVYGTTAGCTDDAAADADYTVIALDALLTTPNASGVSAAITKTVTWLLSQQTAQGGFPGSGGAVNANTAGLAAQAFRQVGQNAAADKAEAFVTSMQLTLAQVADDAGAIAFDVAGHDAAVTAGEVGDQAADQFHRATAQAVLGFGLPNYSGLAVPPPPTTTTTSTSTTTSTTAASSSTTSTSAGASTTASTAAVTSTTAAAAGHGPLPKTGSGVMATVIIGLALVGIGESVRRGAREQARRSRS
jgi:hypothetical protein